MVGAVLLRDLIIVTGGTVYNFRVETVQPAPTLISKLNTVLQIVLAAVGVLKLGVEAVPEWLVQVLVWSVMCTVVLSGAGYVREWSMRARSKGFQHGHH